MIILTQKFCLNKFNCKIFVFSDKIATCNDSVFQVHIREMDTDKN